MVATADPLVGAVIGRYEVVRKIAKGGMGTIYEVRNTKIGRSFALKTITAEAAQDAEVLARFRREADVVANLTHPNIVEVVDWDQFDDGVPYLVMEYLRGETLAMRLAALGALPWPQIAWIADQVLSALGVAHRAGVTHRDLKPDNIFLAIDDAGEERVKLLDFGISKIRDSQTFATTDARMLGTPAYMAPEQAEGQHDKIGPATDVWAMGAILYEMITGEMAFQAPSTPAILYRVCHGRPTPANELRGDLPPELVELLDWALDPDLRLADVDELRDELRRVLGKLDGVSWPAPTKSRIHVAPAEFPRLLTPRPSPITGRSPEIGPRAWTPRPTPSPDPDELPASTAGPDREGGPERSLASSAGASAPASERERPARSMRRGWRIAAGTVGFVAAGVVVFALVSDRHPDANPPPPIVSPAPPPARPAPATVDATIDSRPRGADVYRMPSQVKVGTTPWTAAVERAAGVAVFVVKAPGFRDATVEIDLHAGGTATAALDPVATGPAAIVRRPPPKHPNAGKPDRRKADRRKGDPVNPFESEPR